MSNFVVYSSIAVTGVGDGCESYANEADMMNIYIYIHTIGIQFIQHLGDTDDR